MIAKMRSVALPRQHPASSRLAWRVAGALRARGWSLTTLAVSRRWRCRIGASTWVAQVYVSFFFEEGAAPRYQGGICALAFEGNTSAAALAGELRLRLGDAYTSEPKQRLVRALRAETRPGAHLAELDRIASAFGSDDRHSAPASRPRALPSRLWLLAAAVVKHGTWTLETPAMRFSALPGACVSISPMPVSGRKRAELSSLLFVANRKPQKELIARAEARGYVDHAGRRHPDTALIRLQPLSVRSAIEEATFLEQAQKDEAPGSEDPRASFSH